MIPQKNFRLEEKRRKEKTMARFTLTGTIHNIGAIQSFGSNGFTKREIVIAEEGTKFPNYVKFTLKKDNCALADNYHEGDKVTVSASISGREWENKTKGITQYFVDLEAYKIVDAEGASSKQGNGKKTSTVPPPAIPDGPMDFADDTDIPF